MLSVNKTIKIFSALVFLTFLTPLLFWRNFYLPFTSTKVLFFTLLVELALPFYLYIIYKRKEYRLNIKNPIVLSLLAFTFLGLVSALLGIDFTRSFWGSLNRMGGIFLWLHFLVWLFYIVSLLQVKQKNSGLMFKALVWTASISSFYGILEYLDIYRLGETEFAPRAVSFFGNPVFFGSFLVIPLFLSLYLVGKEHRRNKRYFYLFLTLLIFGGVLVSATRGALLGVAAGVLVGAVIYGIFTNKKRQRLFALSSVSAVLIIAVLVSIFGSSIFPQNSRLSRLTDFSGRTASNRLVQWQTALDGFKENPVFGVGPDNYYYIADKYVKPEFYATGSVWSDKPHNHLLEILTTQGSLGLAAYAALLIFVLMNFFKAHKRGFISTFSLSGLIAAFTAYQAQNFFAFDTISALFTFFFLIAFTVYLSSQRKENKRESRENPNFLTEPVVKTVSTLAAALVLFNIYYVYTPTTYLLTSINGIVALTASEPNTAQKQLDSSVEQRFLWDEDSLALKYHDFATRLALLHSNDESKNILINSSLDKAAELLKGVADNNPYNVEYLLSLSNIYSIRAGVNGNEVPQDAFEVVKKAGEIASDKAEVGLSLVNLYTVDGDFQKAKELLEELLDKYPKHPNVFWKSSVVEFKLGNQERAAVWAEKAFGADLEVNNIRQVAWLINYYVEKKDFPKVIDIYKHLIRYDDKNAELYAKLAAAYAANGQRGKAVETAMKMIELDPNSRASVENFIRNLNSN